MSLNVAKIITEAKLQVATAVIFLCLIPISGYVFNDVINGQGANTVATRVLNETVVANANTGALRDQQLLHSIELMRKEFEIRLSAIEKYHEKGGR